MIEEAERAVDNTGDDGADAARRRRPRRCLASREPREREGLVRFVLDPEGRVVPDVDGRLPGRGMWLSADRDVVDRAVARNLFARAARGRAVADPDLPGRIESLLARRCLDLLGLARRAGEAASGYDAVRAMLLAGEAGLVLAARDGAAGGREKLRALARGLPVITAFASPELGAALGRDGGIVHAAVARGRLARRLLTEATRLAGFRPDSLVPAAAPGAADDDAAAATAAAEKSTDSIVKGPSAGHE